MDKQIQKLKSYQALYLGKTEQFLIDRLGKPLRFSDSDIWFYRFRRKIIFQDEVTFFIRNGKVEDITITEYVSGIAVRNIFYFPKNNRPYQISDMLKKTEHQFL